MLLSFETHFLKSYCIKTDDQSDSLCAFWMIITYSNSVRAQGVLKIIVSVLDSSKRKGVSLKQNSLKRCQLSQSIIFQSVLIDLLFYGLGRILGQNIPAQFFVIR